MGPVTHRHVVLRDSPPPNLVIAVCWTMFASARVPAAIRQDLDARGEQLDRLLTLHGLAWKAEVLPDENRKTSVRDASATFRWATPDTPLLEVTRLVSLGDKPLGVLIDEVPQLSRLGPTDPSIPTPRKVNRIRLRQPPLSTKANRKRIFLDRSTYSDLGRMRFSSPRVRFLLVDLLPLEQAMVHAALAAAIPVFGGSARPKPCLLALAKIWRIVRPPDCRGDLLARDTSDSTQVGSADVRVREVRTRDN